MLRSITWIFFILSLIFVALTDNILFMLIGIGFLILSGIIRFIRLEIER